MFAINNASLILPIDATILQGPMSLPHRMDRSANNVAIALLVA